MTEELKENCGVIIANSDANLKDLSLIISNFYSHDITKNDTLDALIRDAEKELNEILQKVIHENHVLDYEIYEKKIKINIKINTIRARLKFTSNLYLFDFFYKYREKYQNDSNNSIFVNFGENEYNSFHCLISCNVSKSLDVREK